MNLVETFMMGGALLSLGAGGITTWSALQSARTPARIQVSQTGRDHALIRLLQSARTSVYLRTESLTLPPVGNELAQAVQRKVPVTVDLPLAAGTNPVECRLPRLLMDLGATVTFKSDPASNYRGSYMVVDGHKFQYSAAPLGYSPPGALVSYVAGDVN